MIHASHFHNQQYRKQGNHGTITDEEVLTHEIMMRGYYSHDQDKMNASQIYALKRKTFSYLDKTDVRLKMPDRIIIEKERDLDTNSVLSETDKGIVREFYYSCTESLSTHDNPSVQNRTFVSLKPVNLKPFYIKPYLTHEREIKFAEKEVEKIQTYGNFIKGV